MFGFVGQCCVLFCPSVPSVTKILPGGLSGVRMSRHSLKLSRSALDTLHCGEWPLKVVWAESRALTSSLSVISSHIAIVFHMAETPAPKRPRLPSVESFDEVGAESALSAEPSGAGVQQPIAPLFDWPGESKELAGRLVLDSQLLQHLNRCGATSIIVTTSYTGLGTVEYALSRLASVVGPQTSEHRHGAFHYYAAFECDAAFRALLAASSHCPEHIFEKIEGKVDPELVNKMTHMLTACLQRASQLQEEDDNKEKLGALSTRCFLKMTEILLRGLKQGGLQRTAYCYRHQQLEHSWKRRASGCMPEQFLVSSSSEWLQQQEWTCSSKSAAHLSRLQMCCQLSFHRLSGRVTWPS